jgi:hypothetical protein
MEGSMSPSNPNNSTKKELNNSEEEEISNNKFKT